MHELIPQIELSHVGEVLNHYYTKPWVKEIAEILDSNQKKFARKRFFKIVLKNNDKVHLTVLKDKNNNLFDKSNLAYKKLPKLTCKPLFNIERNKIQYFGQEFFDGVPIDKNFHDKNRPVKEFSVLVRNLFNELDSILEHSTQEMFYKELDTEIEKFKENKFLTDLDLLIIDKLIYSRETTNKINLKFKKRFSTGDFIGKNILISSKNEIRLIDFEFARITHFYNEDYYRLSRFSNKEFSNISIIQEKAEDISSFEKAFFWFRQLYLSSKVDSTKVYKTCSRNSLNEILLNTLYSASNNLESEILRNINLDYNKNLRNINELSEKTENKSQKITQLHSLLSSQKEKIDKIILEKTNLENKIYQIQKSFSWRSTSILRFFRRHTFDYLKKTTNTTNNNDKNSIKEKIEFPNYHGKSFCKNIIIIPVYGAHSYFSKCINSVFNNYKDLVVFIIDDKNEPKTKVIIKQAIKKHGIDSSLISLIVNNENLGFVKSVNKAMSIASSRYEIQFLTILNSDTEITKNCIEEMNITLSLFEKHGATSPRSNNATIQTFPTARKLKSNESFLEWKDKHKTLPRYHIIPTCVGFCMMIKFDLIKKFGFFCENYGKGYNEENDFCMRINRKGFSSISSNHAFVFHHESKSFKTKEKLLLEEHNRKILNYKYPEYTKSVDKFIKSENNHFTNNRCHDRQELVIDLSDLPNFHNGTSTFAITITNNIIKHSTSDNINVSIIINKNAYLYHSNSIKCDKILLDENYINKTFDLCYRPMQFFDFESLKRCNMLSKKLIFVMQDIIALRCNYLNVKNLDEIFKKSIIDATGIITISHFSHNDLNMYFNKIIKTKTIYHGLSIHESNNIKSKDFVLLIGNKFDHKCIEDSLKYLNNTKYKIKVITDSKEKNVYSRNIKILKGSKLSDNKIKQLYAECKAIIFPSLYEGFGLPIAHAIEHKKPIITFNTELNKELKKYFYFYKGFYLVNDFGEMIKQIHNATKNEEFKSYRIPKSFLWEEKSRDHYKYIKDILHNN